MLVPMTSSARPCELCDGNLLPHGEGRRIVHAKFLEHAVTDFGPFSPKGFAEQPGPRLVEFANILFAEIRRRPRL
jgi:hypothetical protein